MNKLTKTCSSLKGGMVATGGLLSMPWEISRSVKAEDKMTLFEC